MTLREKTELLSCSYAANSSCPLRCQWRITPTAVVSFVTIMSVACGALSFKFDPWVKYEYEKRLDNGHIETWNEELMVLWFALSRGRRECWSYSDDRRTDGEQRAGGGRCNETFGCQMNYVQWEKLTAAFRKQLSANCIESSRLYALHYTAALRRISSAAGSPPVTEAGLKLSAE